MANRYYRVRIRTADDTGDDLVISSVPGDANEYVISEPTGDGQTLDPIASTVDVGEYSITVGDPSGTRPVTAKLVDSDLRWTLISRRAFVETKTTAAGAWTVLRAGWLIGVTAADALAWEFRIGEADRTEREATVYAYTSDEFPVGTSIIGGPVRGGAAMDRPDFGGWRFGVERLLGDLVELDFRHGMVRVNATEYTRVESDVSGATWRGLHRLTKPFAYPASSDYGAATDIPNKEYPDLVVRLETPSTGAHVGDFMPVSAVTTSVSWWVIQEDAFFTVNGRIRIVWDTATYGPQPAVGQLFDVYVTPRLVNEDFPLHWRGHPVDNVTAHYDALGIAYDAASAAAVKTAIGPVELDRRITASTTVLEDVNRLFAAFGFSRRMNDAGEYEFFLTRRRAGGVPSITITEDDLREETTLFEHVEGSIVNQVDVVAQDVIPWEARNPEAPGDGRPIDDRETVERTYRFNPPETDPPPPISEQERFGVQSVEIVIPGTIVGQNPFQRVFQRASEWASGNRDATSFPYGGALAQELFDIGLRGAPEGVLHVSGDPGAKVGDEIILDIAWQVDPSTFPAGRGGQRVVRVLQATPVGGGVDLRVRDAGRSVTVATVPTISVAEDADRIRHGAIVTITNAAALAAAGLRVRLEWATGAGAPAGAGSAAAVVDPAAGATVGLPSVAGGSVVWVRAQSLSGTDEQPSAFSAWTSVDLTDIPAPGAMTLATVAGDGTALDATWTLGTSDLRVEVRVRENAAEATTRLVATLPAGSDRYRLTGLTPAALHTVEVRHVDDYGGASTAASDTETTGAAPALTAPSAPAVFAGSYTDDAGRTAPVTDGGTYGLEVTATVLPSSTEFEEAVETAVGAGTFGSYVEVGTFASNDAGRTRYVSTAPADGLLRSLRARHRIGDVVSAYTTPLSVDPWGLTLKPIGSRDKIGIVETDGTIMYAAAAKDAEGKALLPDARTRDTAGDRPVVRGFQRGEARHGDVITFAPVYQSVPHIRLWPNRAITHEPRAKYNAAGDGTGATAYQPTKPTYLDLVALNVSASGFELRARLRQPDATVTTRTHNFPANTLSAVGQYAEVTLANAPANNDQYAAQYTVQVGGIANSGTVNFSVTIAVDTWDSVTALPTERAVSPAYTHSETAGVISPGPTSYTDWLTATVAGLDNLDAIRVRVKTITVIGDGTASVTVTAHTGAGGYTAPGVQYTTSASSDLYASMTPPSDVAAVIDWEAVEVST